MDVENESIRGVGASSLQCDDSQIEGTARILQAVAEPTRWKILCLLMKGERCVTDIHESVESSQSVVSHHLALMRARGLIQSRREKNKIYYRLDNPNFSSFARMIHDVFCT